jgi:subtilase family serine protease
MTRGSCPSLIGALAAAVMLAACGGTGGGTSPLQTVPASQATQVPRASQTSQATPSATPAPSAAPAAVRVLATIVGTPEIGVPGTYGISIVVEDAGGSVISGTYATPITLSDSDVTGATRLSTTSLPSSASVASLVYNGLGGSALGGFQGATITATSGTASGDVAFLTAGNGCVTFKDIGGYYPCDLQSAYSLPSMIAGSGQTVAIVDAFSDPNAEADLGVYRSQFGLPPCTTANHCFRKVNQQGIEGSPPLLDSTGWSVEESLDLDMVSAICPNCHLLMVEVNSNASADLGAGDDAAAALGATQISNSWGGYEEQFETAEDVHYEHPNSTIVFSSGDGDFDDTPSYPASSPYVTAVGGTSLTAAANGRGWNEVVWNNANIQGTGSGCSALEPKPAWQKDTSCPNNRMVADVAAVADPFSGVALYDTYITSNLGGWQIVGGTSVAAPIVAGVYALAGASAASLNAASYTYGHASSLNDVTNGNNGYCGTYVQYFCTAEVGYDGPTGNGTPNGLGAFGGPALVSELSKASLGRRPAWRLQVAPGSAIIRACAKPAPGFYGCYALLAVP